MSYELKLKKYKKKIDNYIKSNKADQEEIHALRVATREMYSLLDSDMPLSKEMKKIIKLSNVIRDIDVFVDVYLKFLPREYTSMVDLKEVLALCNKHRKKEVVILHKYLKTFVLPKHLDYQAQELKSKLNETKKEALRFDKKDLHRYRIRVKKALFQEKNMQEKNKDKIKLLTKMKDILGEINDKMNGVQRLKDYDTEPAILERIENFTQKYNKILFDRFKKIEIGKILS
jgi:CHAD domain-containing protein